MGGNGEKIDEQHLLPQSNKHHKTNKKQLGWCGIIIGKKNTTPPPPPHRNDYILSHFQAT